MRRQEITWIKAELSTIGPLRTHFSVFQSSMLFIQKNAFESIKSRSFCIGLNALRCSNVVPITLCTFTLAIDISQKYSDMLGRISSIMFWQSLFHILQRLLSPTLCFDMIYITASITTSQCLFAMIRCEFAPKSTIYFFINNRKYHILS